MTEIDAPALSVWGAGGPPRHPDGSPVITERLYSRLSPLERSLYAGDELVSRIAHRVWWRTGGSPINGWYPEDFVSYGLAEAARYPEVTSAAVVTWVNREIDRARKRDERVSFVEPGRTNDPGAEEFVPSVLPERVYRSIEEHLRPPVAVAVRLYAEQGLTVTEACDTVGVHRNEFYRALETLKGRL